MKVWAVVALLFLAGCVDTTHGYELGSKSEGAYYWSGSLFGGVAIYVYPSGTIVWDPPSYGKRRPSLTIMDRRIWRRIELAVQQDGGQDLQDQTTTEDALCDAGEERVTARVAEKTGFYVSDNNSCEEYVRKSDAAGRQIIAIFRELDERFRRLAARHH